MTKEEFKVKLDRIGEISGDNEEVLELLQLISSDRDELEAREVYNQSDVFDSDGVRWSEKYDNIRRRYRERFFSNPEEVKRNQKEDVEKDEESMQMTFDDLFDKREGDYKKED